MSGCDRPAAQLRQVEANDPFPYEPEAQSIHAEAPLIDEYVPERQPVQPELAEPPAYEPAVQVRHAVPFVVGAYKPRPQFTQLIVPSAAVTVPTAQTAHALFAGRFWYDPIGHCVHEAAIGMLPKVPVEQSVQPVEPRDPANVPSAHG